MRPGQPSLVHGGQKPLTGGTHYQADGGPRYRTVDFHNPVDSVKHELFRLVVDFERSKAPHSYMDAQTNMQSESLLSNLKARIILLAYSSPGSPSDVAKRLDLPANSVHYWTNRLLEGDLLELVDERGRIRTYRSRFDPEGLEPESSLPFAKSRVSDFF